MKSILIIAASLLISISSFAQKKGTVELPWAVMEPKAMVKPYEQGKDGVVLLEVGPVMGKDVEKLKSKAMSVALYRVVFNGYNSKGNIPGMPPLAPGKLTDYNKDKVFLSICCQGEVVLTLLTTQNQCLVLQ